MILPFEEVVEALGRVGERELGLQSIPLEWIVGSVDRGREFDRRFRPTSGRVRQRWERIATEQRRGKAMPPIDVAGDLPAGRKLNPCPDLRVCASRTPGYPRTHE